MAILPTGGFREHLKTAAVQHGYHSRPSFLILGAQKGGTVALYNYLARHPRITPAREKEIGFFAHRTLFCKGSGWYHSHFPLPHQRGRNVITFEATPEYLYYPEAAQRVFSYDPHMKLIVLLREPVARAFSAWNMFRRLCRDRPEYLRALLPTLDDAPREAIRSMLSRKPFPGFDEVVRDELAAMLSGRAALEPSYVRRGLYAEQLGRYYQHFGRDQIAVIESSRLRDDLCVVLHELTAFLGLPEHAWNRNRLPLMHVGRYEASIDPRTRAFIAEYYRPHNEKLYELLGRDLGWDSD